MREGTERGEETRRKGRKVGGCIVHWDGIGKINGMEDDSCGEGGKKRVEKKQEVLKEWGEGGLGNGGEWGGQVWWGTEREGLGGEWKEKCLEGSGNRRLSVSLFYPYQLFWQSHISLYI